MRIVLTTPHYDPLATAIGRTGAPRYGHLPLLGVGYVAGVLRERGHQVAFVDTIALGLDVTATIERILALRPEIIGISCISTQSAPNAYLLAKQLRQTVAKIPIVIGGAHVTSFGRLVLEECPELDVAVPGEGELVFADLVDAYADKRSPDTVPGVIYRAPDGTIRESGAPTLIGNLDEIPFPDRTIYDHGLYRPLMNLNLDSTKPATSVITSRGCPWNRCRFCFRGGYYQSRYRRRSPENVVAEIRDIVRNFDIHQIKFLDDNFCINEQWVSRFCDLLDKERLRIEWAVLGRVDTVTENMLKRMARSGCRSVQFGIESGNQELLDMIDKGITLAEIRQAVRWAKAAGLSVMGFCILGLPTETQEMTQRTINFACELNIDYMFFVPYYPFNGTILGEIAKETGTIYRNGVDIHCPAYVPHTYPSREALHLAVMRAYRKYYLRPAYVALAASRCIRRPKLVLNYVRAVRDYINMLVKSANSSANDARHGSKSVEQARDTVTQG